MLLVYKTAILFTGLQRDFCYRGCCVFLLAGTENGGAGLYIGTRLRLFNTCTDEIQCQIARAFIGSSGVEFSLGDNETFSSWCLQF